MVVEECSGVAKVEEGRDDGTAVVEKGNRVCHPHSYTPPSPFLISSSSSSNRR